MSDLVQPETLASGLLTPSAAAEFCGYSESTFANLRCQGSGPPFFKIGGGRGRFIRYDRSDLIDWMRSRRYRSTSEVAS